MYTAIGPTRQFRDITRACCEDEKNVDNCDYTNADERTSECWKTITKNEGHNLAPIILFTQRPYNFNRDCYSEKDIVNIDPNRTKLSYLPMDGVGAYSCDRVRRIQKYLNQANVQAAIHTEADKEWNIFDIRLPLVEGSAYQAIYDDMSDVYADILKDSDISILIYNGDQDLVCDFRGAEEFVEEVAAANGLQEIGERKWIFHREALAGVARSFQKIDFVTIKGAGHYAAIDRPGPVLQVIANFLKGSNDYSQSPGIGLNNTSLEEGA